ncbi:MULTISPECIES: GntR family transcriptional regulator [Achromobacter]|uniref:GntR family transcriptional regulator n=1 Tax=Achromobacter spanius TaxID=217203 RepID=A0ABY8GUR5_9BURK|nr:MULTISPECIES: GntR family transcriptional regulator [Achromobacter]WAI82168.1 GntR family transcriptional regulator [Achromobacter spanius]WEX92257.1 GntR family transcriptional regulator [Achromobacter sp. SS2-2022]WFP08595.1 GntR family transcriptional regulator [Achromobacter spanius]
MNAITPDALQAEAPDATQSAVAALEEDIVFGRLHPRERLTEDELMARFSMKRHAVRQVLTELELLGVVEKKRNVGAVVRTFSAREVMELYALREVLEVHAASQIPLPVPEARLAALVMVQREHDAAVTDGDARRVFRSNQRFHHEFFGLLDNAVLGQAIEEYARRTHPIRFGTLVAPAYRERARQEHWAMIQALRAGDRDALMAICRDHLLPSRDAYLASEQTRLRA